MEATNLTILNFLLIHWEPMNEKQLVQTLMSVQVCRVNHIVLQYLCVTARLLEVW